MRGALLVCAGMGVGRARAAAGERVGLGQPGHLAVPRRRARAAAAFARFELRNDDPLVPMRLFADRGLRRRQRRAVPAVDLLRAAVLLHQPLLADRARRKRRQRRAGACSCSSSASPSAHGAAARSSTARARARPSCPAARSPPSASTCGARNSTTCRSANSGTSSRSPASASAWCSGRSSTDALNRAARATYGAVTGLTQTVRNFGGSLGLAVLGSILITENVSRVEKTLGRVRRAQGAGGQRSRTRSPARRRGSGGKAPVAHVARLTHQIQLDFAHSTQTVVYGMAAAMALAFVVALRAMPGGRARAGRRGGRRRAGRARRCPRPPAPASPSRAAPDRLRSTR